MNQVAQSAQSCSGLDIWLFIVVLATTYSSGILVQLLGNEKVSLGARLH